MSLKALISLLPCLSFALIAKADPIATQAHINMGQGGVLLCQSEEDTQHSQLAYRLSKPEASIASNVLSASIELQFMSCNQLDDGTYGWQTVTSDLVIQHPGTSDEKKVLVEERHSNPELVVVSDDFSIVQVLSLNNKSAGRLSFQVDLSKAAPMVADAGGISLELMLRTQHEYRVDGGEWVSTGPVSWNSYILKSAMAPAPTGLELHSLRLVHLN